MEIFKNATKLAGVCLKNKNMYVSYVLSMGLRPIFSKKLHEHLDYVCSR